METCQSCAMHLGKDRGTEKDGSPSKEYCFYCYQNGKFVDGCTKLEDKIEQVVKIAASSGLSEQDSRKQAKEKLSKLKRWK